MKLFINIRKKRGISQRAAASLSGVSFRIIQLIESGGHNARLSTLQKIAGSFGYPPKIIELTLARIFSQPSDSAAMISERILSEGADSWKIWLFDFVDAFRSHRDPAYVSVMPTQDLPIWLNALIASVVETLCEELEIAAPSWCSIVPPLKAPWFVSNAENLKASALLESPLHFRKRNIFVLGNFLSRR